MRLPRDRPEEKAPVVTEVEPLKHLPGKPILERGEHGYPARALMPVAVRALVHLVTGLPAEQRRHLLVLVGDEMNRENARPSGNSESVVLHRDADEEARGMDR